ncbi:PREDICTED: zinc finger BED domain-containing protein 5-like [Diuraphis noxia]|uniref:zinc finger BED domain-containing protein 5-like n=1 Tax=Diuraphis noxia TaxID=143948 RepID=UPI00076384B9|nr:PREDICTED: zinc finger BED domain-containing protein 5-like [Diuraphis noxia]
MSENVKIAIITVLKQSEYFSLQLDESTDVAGEANLLVFVRFELNGNIEEEMLFCQSLSTKTTGEDIFKSVDSFIKGNKVDWSKCVGLTTDGARAMSGIHTGLIVRVRSVAPLVQWTHCSIHREALAVKGLDECLKKTLDGAVKIVNFIKARPKNSRLFGVLCDEMGSEHKQLLLHCDVRWLSRGKVLSRLFELRDELRVFLMEGGYDGKLASSYLELVTDENWLKRLAYLADIFGALNVLNLTLQGKHIHKFFVQDKVDAMIIKLQRWALKVEQDSFNAFPVQHDFL